MHDILKDKNGKDYQVQVNDSTTDGKNKIDFVVKDQDFEVADAELYWFVGDDHAIIDMVHVENDYRGKGIYVAMINLMKDFVKTHKEIKGIVSLGMHRSKDAEQSWQKIPDKKEMKTKGEDGKDYTNYVLEHLVLFEAFNPNSDEFKKKMRSLEAEYKKKGLQLELMLGMNQSVYLSKIVVPEDQREEGLGSAFMKQFIDLADEYGFYIQVSPADTYGGTVSRLKKFYNRFGFLENKGRHRDDRFWYEMLREPKERKVKESYEIYTNKKGAKFWGDMGAGVLPICKTTGRILVSYRSKYVNEPHTWGVFGGAVDDGEKDPMVAAERELVEESGYEGKFELIPAYVYDTPDFQYHNFIGIVEAEFKPTLDWETEKTKWMTLDELKKLSPKHFGLEALLKNSMRLIEQYAKAKENS